MSEKYKLVDTWVREAKAGDQKASELLLHTFRPLMLSMVQKYVYNPAEYEDGLQEASVVLLETLKAYPGSYTHLCTVCQSLKVQK